MKFVPYILIACAALGCKSKLSHYNGKSLEEWAEQTKGTDSKSRMEAYNALHSFGKDRAAVDALAHALADESLPPSERFVVAQNIYRTTGDAEPIIEPVRDAIRRETTAPHGFASARELEDLIYWLGPKAQPLVSDLVDAHIRFQTSLRDPRAARVQKLIDAVPKE